MYLLEFVNRVRGAQRAAPIEELPAPAHDGSSPVELAMGCRFEGPMMRLSSPHAAAAVAGATGLPVGVDQMCVAIPPPLGSYALCVEGSRQGVAATACS